MSEELDVISKFDGKKVLVIGDVMVDKYIYGTCERISPEAPVPVIKFKREEKGLGGAANAALNLKMLGADVTICTKVGADEGGTFLHSESIRNEINWIRTGKSIGFTTTSKTRVIVGNQQICRIDNERLFTDSIDVSGFNWEEFDAVFVSDYGKGIVDFELMDQVRLSGLPFYCDPKSTKLWLYEGADGITPNETELCNFDFGFGVKGTFQKHFVSKNIKTCLVTCGDKGVQFWDGNECGLFLNIEARKVELADACGAGDTAFAVFGLSKLCGASTYTAASLANLAGSLVCEHFGVTPITRLALVNALNEMGD